MKKFITFFILINLVISPVFAREQVVIRDEAYAPEQNKKQTLNVDAVFGGPANPQNSQRANTNRPRESYYPQGQSQSEKIVRAQQKNKKEANVGANVDLGQDPMSNIENQYRRLGNIYYMKMLMKAEDELIKMQRQRVLDEKKYREETSIKSDNANFERLMGVNIPANAQPLPVISAPEVKKPEPVQQSRRNINEEPQLRVVGIQGYKGKFTAQIMNNGGLSSVSPGMDLEYGVHVLSISEDGVKVRRTRQFENGESKTEVITLPLSK